MSPHLVAQSLLYRHPPPGQRRLTRRPATRAQHPNSSSPSPRLPPPARDARRAPSRSNTRGRRTHGCLGLQVGAPVRQQLHRGRVAMGCSRNKRRGTTLRGLVSSTTTVHTACDRRFLALATQRQPARRDSERSRLQCSSIPPARPHRAACWPRRCSRPPPPPRARVPLHFRSQQGWPCCQMC